MLGKRSRLNLLFFYVAFLKISSHRCLHINIKYNAFTFAKSHLHPITCILYTGKRLQKESFSTMQHENLQKMPDQNWNITLHQRNSAVLVVRQV